MLGQVHLSSASLLSALGEVLLFTVKKAVWGIPDSMLVRRIPAILVICRRAEPEG